MAVSGTAPSHLTVQRRSSFGQIVRNKNRPVLEKNKEKHGSVISGIFHILWFPHSLAEQQG